MKYDILTLFPDIIQQYCQEGVIGRAWKTKQCLDIAIHDIREYSSQKHGKVDDSPFGGGPGMIMQIDPIYQCLHHIIQSSPETQKHILFPSPSGNQFTQEKALEYSQIEHIILICGRYEGIDYRVEQYLSHESISVGPYVLSGGELPALLILDAVSRHIPGVLGNPQSAQDETWMTSESEYPQYTRPASYKPENPHLVSPQAPQQWSVPEVLLSGDHAAIQQWRDEHSW